MILYQPTPSEIAAALAKAAVNFPHLASDGRVDRAAAILAGVHTWIAWTDTETIWRIPSCSDPTVYHRLDAMRCDCPDWHAKKVLADGMPVCKHSLALRAYRYITLLRLTAQIAEDGIRLSHNGFGHYLAYRDAAEFRLWRKYDTTRSRQTGPYRFRADYDLCLYAAQLHAETDPNYKPPAIGWTQSGTPFSVPNRQALREYLPSA